ncbi:MAG: TIGR02147 family protein [Exiguobacterium sp.]|nr:TIGR02147 family protein [Exiguobacterium sp.]
MRDYYEERKRTSYFSWREFAKLAGFSSSGYLKLVCDGKTRLRQDGALKVARAMELSGYRREYFCLLVEFCDAPDERSRIQAFSRMRALMEENGVRVLGAEAFDYYRSWVNSVVRELAPMMPGAKPSDIAKLCIPEVTAGEVRNSLELMVRANLLERCADGSYVQMNKGLTGDPALLSASMKAMQKQVAQLAADALDNVPAEERNISGFTLGISENTYRRLVEEIGAFRKRIKEIVSDDKGCNRIYRLNLQLFPLSEKLKDEND